MTNVDDHYHGETDDPRLTAYALGELSGAERASVEAVLKSNAPAAREIERIRRSAALIEDAMRAEPGYALTPAQRARIERALAGSDDSAHIIETRSVFRLPRAAWYTAGGLALAALLALAFVIPILVGEQGAGDLAGLHDIGRPEPAVRDDARTTDDSPLRSRRAADQDGDRLSQAGAGAEGMRRLEVEAAAEESAPAEPRPGGGAAVPTAPARDRGAGFGGGGAGDQADAEHPAEERERRQLVDPAASPVPAREMALRVGGSHHSLLCIASGPDSVRAMAESVSRGEKPAEVRVDELINHFVADVSSAGRAAETDVHITSESAVAPWNGSRHLVRVAVTNVTDEPIEGAMLGVRFDPDVVESWEVIGYERAETDDDQDEAIMTWALAPNATFVALYEVAPRAGAGLFEVGDIGDPGDEQAAAPITLMQVGVAHAANVIDAADADANALPEVQHSVSASPQSIRNTTRAFRMSVLAAATGLALQDDPRLTPTFLSRGPEILSDVLTEDFDQDSLEAELISLMYNVRRMHRGPSPSGGGQ